VGTSGFGARRLSRERLGDAKPTHRPVAHLGRSWDRNDAELWNAASATTSSGFGVGYHTDDESGTVKETERARRDDAQLETGIEMLTGEVARLELDDTQLEGRIEALRGEIARWNVKGAGDGALSREEARELNRAKAKLRKLERRRGNAGLSDEEGGFAEVVERRRADEFSALRRGEVAAEEGKEATGERSQVRGGVKDEGEAQGVKDKAEAQDGDGQEAGEHQKQDSEPWVINGTTDFDLWAREWRRLKDLGQHNTQTSPPPGVHVPGETDEPSMPSPPHMYDHTENEFWDRGWKPSGFSQDDEERRAEEERVRREFRERVAYALAVEEVPRGMAEMTAKATAGK
jgi:hypothetical protein